MRVLLVLPGAEIGGVQRHVEDLATGLHRRRVDVVVAPGSSGPLVERLTRAHLPVHVIPMRSRRDRPRAVPALRTLARSASIDLVHTHGPLAGLFGRDAAWRDGRPFVHTLHGRGVANELRAPHGPLHWLKLQHYRGEERRWNERSDLVIAVSPAVGAAAVRDGDVPEERLTTIASGVDVEALARGADQRGAFGWAAGTPVVGYLGRLAEEKDPLTFVAMARRVADARPDARFLLVGDGPLRAAVDAAIAHARLDGVCVVAGAREDVANVLATCDVLVLPSRYEGLSLTLLEAWSAGVAVVGAAVTGIRDVLEDGRTGVLVPPGDPAGAAAEVIRLLEDPARRAFLVRAARDEVHARYTLNRMVDVTLAAYRGVIARAHAVA